MHFCSLVRILNLCLQFEISEKDINTIELGICKWVVDYKLCILSFRFWKIEGWWSTHPASTTSTALSNSLCACSQYTHCFTFLTKSDGWDCAEQHGLSPLRGNVVTFNAASRVDKIPMWAWISTVLICHSSGKSSFYMILLMSSSENLPLSPLCKQRGLKIVSCTSVPSS